MLCKNAIEFVVGMPAEKFSSCNIASKDVIGNHGNLLTNERVAEWCVLHYYSPTSVDDRKMQPVCFNSNIRIGNKPITWKSFFGNRLY